MKNNLWLIILPILLFVFKDFFPELCELIFKYKSLKGLGANMHDKILLFPVDLLFIAISYTTPKVVEVIAELSLISTKFTDDAQKFNHLNQYYPKLLNYYLRCGIMFVILPFMVIFTKYAVLISDNNKKFGSVMYTIIHYVISITAVIYSLFLYQ